MAFMNRLTLFLLILFSSINAQPLRTLYPSIDPYNTGFLEVGEGHIIYWEESGNPNGQPILFLHGGPGLGTEPHNRSFFNPAFYRIILFDQRGCGKSLPFACLENNTTWDLVQDIEHLRTHLKIDKWYLFGGSWGSTLALTYAIYCPDMVEGLILRGIFLCRPQEIHWFYQHGAHHIFPDFWQDFIASIPCEERDNLVQAFYKRLTGTNTKERAEAAKAWAMWEGKTSQLKSNPITLRNFPIQKAYSLARIECHYFVHNSFYPTDNWILENAYSIRHLPCIVIQGRYDMVCPMTTAWDLYHAWPEIKFEIIPDAGHSSSEVGIVDALIRATDSLIQRVKNEE